MDDYDQKETGSMGHDNVLSEFTTTYFIPLSKYYNVMIKQLLAIKKSFISIHVLSNTKQTNDKKEMI